MSSTASSASRAYPGHCNAGCLGWPLGCLHTVYLGGYRALDMQYVPLVVFTFTSLAIFHFTCSRQLASIRNRLCPDVLPYCSSPWRWRPSFELSSNEAWIQAWAGIHPMFPSARECPCSRLACMMHQASLLTTTTSFVQSSILYVSNPKSEADLVEYSSGTQPKGRIQVAEGWVGDYW